MKKLILIPLLLIAVGIIHSSSISTDIPEDSSSGSRAVAESLYRRALLLERGNDSVEADPAEALRLMRMSAGAGFPAAMNYLGWNFSNGTPALEANTDSALYWFRRALDAGDPRAAANLGYMMLLRDTPATDSLAVGYLRTGANAGQPQAASMLADLLAIGRGTAPDTTEALRLYRFAARKGIADAEIKMIETGAPLWHRLSPDSALKLARTLFDDGFRETPAFILDMTDTTGTYLSATGTLSEYHLLKGDILSSDRASAYSYRGAIDEYYRAAMLGNRRACLILAETLEIFPDALAHLNSTLTPGILRQMADRGN